MCDTTGREGLSAYTFSHNSSVSEIAGDDGGITVFVHRYELSTAAAHVKHTAEHAFSALDGSGAARSASTAMPRSRWGPTG